MRAMLCMVFLLTAGCSKADESRQESRSVFLCHKVGESFERGGSNPARGVVRRCEVAPSCTSEGGCFERTTAFCYQLEDISRGAFSVCRPTLEECEAAKSEGSPPCVEAKPDEFIKQAGV
jgi:hypothetical protein